MATPKVADTKPKKAELEEGKNYAWCACGESKNQPFCDGSHKTTAFTPVVFKAEKTETKNMCMCKQSATPMFCDGTHNRL
ncbi:MAG: CDGSH-type Zn-finger protein [Marinoscillum sp.]|jgi:CDGSH-type Zn-finger protein